MADYRDDIYESVDALFQQMQDAKDHFAEDNILEDPTSYEIPDSQIVPVGWVENADPDTDGAASVLIDSDGITILNGKIFLSDPGGNSVLGPAGFAGSWIDFLADGFYNSKFAYGTTGALIDSTTGGTGGAATPQDYANGISFDLPYWLIDILSGTGAPELIADANATGGRALWWDDDIEAVIFQDVPVSPSRNYGVMMSWKWLGATNNVTRTISLSWRDSTHAIIGTEIETGLVFSTDQLTYQTSVISPTLAAAPANAAYLRVGVTIDTTSGAAAEATINHLRVTESTLEGLETLSFGSGTTILFENSSGALETESTFTAPRVRATSTTDLALASTGHGFQVGSTTGDNVAIDNNEIMARNNGATAVLFLQRDGGNVNVANAAIVLQDDGGITGGSLVVNGGITANFGDEPILISGNNFIEFQERGAGDPAAGADRTARLYIKDNGSNKSVLRVRFNSGAIQTIATEP